MDQFWIAWRLVRKAGHGWNFPQEYWTIELNLILNPENTRALFKGAWGYDCSMRRNLLIGDAWERNKCVIESYDELIDLIHRWKTSFCCPNGNGMGRPFPMIFPRWSFHRFAAQGIAPSCTAAFQTSSSLLFSQQVSGPASDGMDGYTGVTPCYTPIKLENWMAENSGDW